MSSYRQLLYHLVFRTKDSLPTINQDHTDQLYAYITGIIKNKSSHLYRINGVENHLHILTDLHPSIALADFMREINYAPIFRAYNRVSTFTPGYTGGYSYMALSELVETVFRSAERNRVPLSRDELTEGNLPRTEKSKSLCA